MASEIMAVPEEILDEVIQVIRIGLARADVSERTKDMLREWCEAEQDYLDGMKEDT